MGRKKPVAGADNEEPLIKAPGGGKKNKKKDHAVDDDEYSIATIESVDDEDSMDKQTVNGKSNHKITEEMSTSVDDAFANKNQEKKKGKKAPADNVEDADSGRKKGKKGKKDFKVVDDEFDIGYSVKSESVEGGSTLDDLDVAPISKPLKIKQSKKGSQADAFSLLATVDDEKSELQEPPQVEGDLEANDGAEGIVFTGKKKKRCSKSKDSEFLNETTIDKSSENDEKLTVSLGERKSLEEGDDEPIIVFSGKKKSKSKKGTLASSSVYDMIPVEEEAAVSTELPVNGGKGDNEFGRMTDTQGISDPPESSFTSKKQTKKKKKGGRTAQEEEDLDNILAELGEGPPSTKPAPVVTKTESAIDEQQPSVKTNSGVVVSQGSAEPFVTADAQAEAEESAAARKKKKKKEKEKEKKAAAAAGANENQGTVVKEETLDAKSKLSDKKVPKHVREMQERLAKLKEAEEKKKQEEEERLRKEEEDRIRLEELERQKEEAKRRKKEREKEKLQKKKQEGKLLTGKQKEEARRLALMREQFLAQGGLPTDVAGAAKKPKYESRKKKPTPAPASQKAVEVEEIAEPKPQQLDLEKVEDEPMIEENMDQEIEHEPEEEAIEDDEDEWDAKNWDEDVVLPPIKSAFEEEDVDPVVKKGTKHVMGLSSKTTNVHNADPSSTENRVSSESSATAKIPSAPGRHVDTSSKRTEGSDDEEDESGDEAVDVKTKKEAAMSREERRKEALAKRSADDLRSPICCILGHVDTGKTKLLDCIRRTNVQEGEAGGITQQIGATYFPMENIKERTKDVKVNAELRVPGLLVIDTPGHESFTNLRSRGTGLCDIAILVIDIMHGLEQQTLESINLLKFRKTPFVVALNKVDRLYMWKSIPNGPIQKVLKQQSRDTTLEFERRLSEVTTQLKEQGLNSELYYRNKELAKYVSIVPTSAISGEGIPDLLMLLVQLTQKRMEQKLMFISEVECTVLEVKVIEGLGTTIDVVLVNGVLHEGDQIVVCGMQGPIVTNIRALLTPHPMKELRVKGTYQHHKELKAAQGIKITAQGLEHAIAGTQLYVVGSDDDLEEVKEEAMADMENIMKKIDKSGEGVCVQASTLGSLEALLEYLKSVKVPVSGISIGPVHKKDVMRAGVMLERKMKEYAVILAFDVKVTPEAKELAEEAGVRIFMADIIYHLFDQFTVYMNNLKEEKKRESADEAVFPCVLKIVPNCVFNQKDPIILGVDILEGILKVGTPICVPSRDFICIGRIASIEDNHKHVDIAKKGQKVAVKIVGSNPEEAQKMYNRHFTLEDELVSQISRRSIDVLKENYREDLTNEEWRLVVKLKNLFKIQ